jgi:putative transposase
VKQKSIEAVAASSPTWETLEALTRQGMQQLLQRMLEDEVDGVLGRGRYERREAIDPRPGYRNGFGKPRRLSLSKGTITLRRPRVPELSERFESRRLPAFKRRTEDVGNVLPELYLQGLPQGDFDLALRGLLGAGAPLSAASIARLKAGWQAKYELWKTRAVDDLEVVYLWVDGVYVKAGLEKGHGRDPRRPPRAARRAESASRRRERVPRIGRELGGDLADLKRRGLPAPKLVIGDGHLGIRGALAAVFPEADWERMMTFYQFPLEHWKHPRTSNPVESPFGAVRLRTAVCK